MPKTTPKAEAAANGALRPDNAPKFVRLDLTADQKEKLKLWAAEAEDIDMLKWLEARIVNGHTMTLRSNETGYQCSLTGIRETSAHVGISLVSRASTPLRALQACWYKDEVVLQGKWPVSNALSELDF